MLVDVKDKINERLYQFQMSAVFEFNNAWCIVFKKKMGINLR